MKWCRRDFDNIPCKHLSSALNSPEKLSRRLVTIKDEDKLLFGFNDKNLIDF